MHTPLPIETLDLIFGLTLNKIPDSGSYHLELERGYILTKLTKVCKSWRAAAVSHLYSSIAIYASYRDITPRHYVPKLRRTLEENPSICRLVKEVKMFGSIDASYKNLKQEEFEKLFQVCSHAPRVILNCETLSKAYQFRSIISSMKLSELGLKVRRGSEYFFRNDEDMIRFIMTMPDLSRLWCSCEMFGDDRAQRPFFWPSNGNNNRDDDSSDDDVGVENMEVISAYGVQARQPLLPETSPHRKFHLIDLEIYKAGLLTEDGLGLLSNLELPFLRSFRAQYVGSERSDTSIMQCFNTWPAELEVLEVHRDGKIISDLKEDISKSFLRLTSLKKVQIPGTIVDLDSALGIPSLSKLVYKGTLSKRRIGLLAENLIRKTDGIAGVYDCCPMLHEFSVSWRHKRRPHRKPCYNYDKFMDICRIRRIDLKVTYYDALNLGRYDYIYHNRNIQYDAIPAWHDGNHTNFFNLLGFDEEFDADSDWD